MGNTCTSSCTSSVVNSVDPQAPADEQHPSHGGPHTSCPDPLVYDLVRRNNPHAATHVGQHHLLYNKKTAHQYSGTTRSTSNVETAGGFGTEVEEASPTTTTRLVLRKLKPESHTHIYAIRSSETDRPEQRPTKQPEMVNIVEQQQAVDEEGEEDIDLTVDPYIPAQMSPQPLKKVHDWVCVSEELNIYIADSGLSHLECDALVRATEQVCKGHYAAYTYAKQTLGCREFPTLAHACFDPVHRITHCIWSKFPNATHLQLDDREPHIVKYDVTKKERQKLDMHTDKSEWTFLIALSDGCNLDYDGGGTYFEALDATVHVQRGHALIFPGKLRHCGQRITKGLRFLLVGFLVDKQHQQVQAAAAAAAAAAGGGIATDGSSSLLQHLTSSTTSTPALGTGEVES